MRKCSERQHQEMLNPFSKVVHHHPISANEANDILSKTTFCNRTHQQSHQQLHPKHLASTSDTIPGDLKVLLAEHQVQRLPLQLLAGVV